MTRPVLALLVGVALVLAAAKPTATTTAPAYAWLYVARDRDADKQASIGDEARWFVAYPSDAVVVLACWTDATKATRTVAWTSPTVPGPSSGYATPFGLDLTTGGYCESSGRGADGRTFGLGWTPVAP